MALETPPRSFFAARAALALCGFSAVIAQIVLMRELVQVFNGNEIALGILLATWLLWTAFGSAFASVLQFARKRPRIAVAALECLLAASLPATIWALRNAKAFFQTVPGELVGPVPMLLTSLVCLSVFCAASGALFVAAARLIAAEIALSARAASSAAYLLEAAGSALGGILSSIVLVRFLQSFQIAAIVALLNLSLAAALLLRIKRSQVAFLAAATALAAIPLLLSIAPRCDSAAQARLWRSFHVVAERNSIYGNLIVTETGDNRSSQIRSLYENASILANAPDPAAAEEAVDYALLEHAAPQRVLLIGGGVNGSVAEALKHPTVESLDYVELDPALIGLAQQYFPAQTAVFRSDPRVHLHFLDGRSFLSETRESFDVIIVDVPDPETAQLNRFYTVEFFRLARAHLESGGLLAVQLRSSEETINPDLAEFLRSIRRTLGEAFPYQAAIPGETIHFFAANQRNVLTEDPQLLITRLHRRNLNTQYVSQYFIPYRMMPDRMEQVEAELAPLPSTPVNRDFAPIAYAFDVVLWSEQFKSGYTAWFRAAEHLTFARVGSALAIALTIVVAVIASRARRARAAAGFSVAATGFTLMALQIFLLLGFQAVFGYVYTELAILIGLFMAGIALGSWLAMRGINAAALTDRSAGLQTGCRAGIHARTHHVASETRIESREGFVPEHKVADCGKDHLGRGSAQGHDFSRAERAAKSVWALAPPDSSDRFALPAAQLLLALAAPALLIVLSAIGDFSSRTATWLAAQILFPALATLVGMLGGFQFVTAANIFLRERREVAGFGLLYAIDLLGGCIGALALSTFLIPVFGFWRTAWLVAAMNAAALLLVLWANLSAHKAAL